VCVTQATPFFGLGENQAICPFIPGLLCWANTGIALASVLVKFKQACLTAFRIAGNKYLSLAQLVRALLLHSRGQWRASTKGDSDGCCQARSSRARETT
jgi:hypothetical protein